MKTIFQPKMEKRFLNHLGMKIKKQEVEYEIVHSYNSSKKMWDILALAYEGTSQVRAPKASKDLKKLPMKELLGTLKVHEIELNEDKGQRKDKSIVPSKLRNLVKKPLMKKDIMRKRSPLSQGRSTPCEKIKEDPNERTTLEVKDKSQLVYYKCKKPGHFKSKCPSLEKEKEKEKKKPIYRRNVSSQYRRTLILNIYLVANVDSEEAKDDDEELSKEFDSLQKENDLLKKKNEKVNEKLQDEIINLRQSLAKFVNGSKNLKNILKHKRHLYDKTMVAHITGKEKGLCSKSLGLRQEDELRLEVTRKIGKIGKHPFPYINNVLFIKGLKHLVRCLPSLVYKENLLCDACKKGKQVRRSFESKNIVSTSKPLDLLHIDLFGPTKIASMSGKRYGLMLSRWTWVMFLDHKDKSDHGGKIENENFQKFYKEYDMLHNISCPRTPQQNGVMEKKNISLQKIARTISKKTPYESWNGRQPNISYSHPFGCKYFILNTKDNLGKFDPKSDKGTFLGYSNASKAYGVYNSITLIVDV
ncbi:hypothetical protein CR513_60213, partial [Mucuna pruriens]